MAYAVAYSCGAIHSGYTVALHVYFTYTEEMVPCHEALAGTEKAQST